MILDETMKCGECGSIRFVVIKSNRVKEKVQIHEKYCSKYKEYKGVKLNMIETIIVNNDKKTN